MLELRKPVIHSISPSRFIAPVNRRSKITDMIKRLWTRLKFRIFLQSDTGQRAVKMKSTTYLMPHSQLNSPPILVVHGLNLSRNSWRRTARHLTKQGSRWLITVDARNHGKSPISANHTPAAVAHDVAAFIQHNNLSRIVGLGHGIGGRAIMTLALTKPEVDITPGLLPQKVLKSYRLFQLMERLLPTLPRDLTLFEARKIVILELRQLVKSDFDLLRLSRNLRKRPDGKFVWNVNTKAILDGWDQSMVNYEKTIKGFLPYQSETLNHEEVLSQIASRVFGC